MAKTKAGDATIVNGPATAKTHTLPQTGNAEKERSLVAVGLVGLTGLLVMLGLGKKTKRD
ncbi:LPXTG cell wall anchor domain-containing protein [Limosilactobacillus difficilis]|uniref:LPXTG cell wall anchor domain-containing protein n=1 Tax=Limosilactobacillus difficilis TaxID=2991838 RepID=UPI0024BB3B0D|nr:LPXTG cell wall anchor domain-containing protein [Limosilactobacillus difficilis]